MPNTKISLGATGTLTLQLTDEPNEPPIDLAPVADMLMHTGLEAGLDNTGTSNGDGDTDTDTDTDTTVDFGTLTADGTIRFYLDGRRITTHAGLTLVADGLRTALHNMVKDHPVKLDEVTVDQTTTD